MSQEILNLGTVANDRTGDTWRAGGEKINSNFTELYSALGADPVIFIAQESDFPTQDATSITLEAGIIYQYTASFTTAKYFDVQDGAKLTAWNFFSPVLTYSGSGSMFVGTDASFTIKECRIDHPNAQGFSFTDTIGGQFSFLNEKVRSVSGIKYGTFNDMQTVLIEGSSSLNMSDGITFTGSNNIIISIAKFFLGTANTSFIALDLGVAISQTWEFDDVIAIGGVGSIGISGAASSANVPVGVIATVAGCDFSGVTTSLSGVAQDDIRWEFLQNSSIEDTNPDALASLNNNVTETVISIINTPVKVAGTWVCEGESHFTCDTTGRVTYNGERSLRAPVDLSATIISASGTNKDIHIYFALNGTVISNTGTKNRVGAIDPGNTSIPWQVTFSQNDYIEIFIENNSDTVNLVCEDAVLRIR